MAGKEGCREGGREDIERKGREREAGIEVKGREDRGERARKGEKKGGAGRKGADLNCRRDQVIDRKIAEIRLKKGENSTKKLISVIQALSRTRITH